MPPADPRFEERVRASFAKQRVMAAFGAILERGAPGEVAVRLTCREEPTQQHGFLHAGVVTAIVDSACGYAALTLMPPDAGVLSVEFKLNLLAPARGEAIVGRGRVVKAGRTITVCTGDVVAIEPSGET